MAQNKLTLGRVIRESHPACVHIYERVQNSVGEFLETETFDETLYEDARDDLRDLDEALRQDGSHSCLRHVRLLTNRVETAASSGLTEEERDRIKRQFLELTGRAPDDSDSVSTPSVHLDLDQGSTHAAQ